MHAYGELPHSIDARARQLEALSVSAPVRQIFMDRMGWYLLSCPLLTNHFHVLILEEIDRYLQSMLSLASSGLVSACATELD